VKIGPTWIEDTFAEAFAMRYARLLVTAHDDYWLDAAVREFTGYGTSVIACDLETGLERTLAPHQSPDGRTGAAILAFGLSRDVLAAAVPNRTGQCLMTCATTAVFDGLVDADERIALGKHLRYFGDGFQKSKLLDGRRYWRIPVMDGEFLVEEQIGVRRGVAGGNLIVQAADQPAALAAVRRAVAAIGELDGVITPFPGGVARSGSKVGSRYKKLKASTSDAYCPTLRGRAPSKLHEGVHCALEIVIDGVSESSVAQAMAIAIRAAAGEGVIAVGAGNYGGKLGKYHFHLHEVLRNHPESGDANSA
jgi:formylmethanofuran--tetrahydromethanopterin N-formyltransferase